MSGNQRSGGKGFDPVPRSGWRDVQEVGELAWQGIDLDLVALREHRVQPVEVVRRLDIHLRTGTEHSVANRGPGQAIRVRIVRVGYFRCRDTTHRAAAG